MIRHPLVVVLELSKHLSHTHMCGSHIGDKMKLRNLFPHQAVDFIILKWHTI